MNAGRYAREASPSIASPAAPVVSSATSPPHLHNGGNEINNETGERRSSTRSVSSSSPSETTKAFGSTTVFDDHSGRTMVETPETYNPIFISSATTITVRQNDSVSIPCEVKNLGKQTLHFHLTLHPCTPFSLYTFPFPILLFMATALYFLFHTNFPQEVQETLTLTFPCSFRSISISRVLSSIFS